MSKERNATEIVSRVSGRDPVVKTIAYDTVYGTVAILVVVVREKSRIERGCEIRTQKVRPNERVTKPAPACMWSSLGRSYTFVVLVNGATVYLDDGVSTRVKITRANTKVMVAGSFFGIIIIIIIIGTLARTVRPSPQRRFALIITP